MLPFKKKPNLLGYKIVEYLAIEVWVCISLIINSAEISEKITFKALMLLPAAAL
jgi:hypothetical protein